MRANDLVSYLCYYNKSNPPVLLKVDDGIYDIDSQYIMSNQDNNKKIVLVANVIEFKRMGSRIVVDKEEPTEEGKEPQPVYSSEDSLLFELISYAIAQLDRLGLEFVVHEHNSEYLFSVLKDGEPFRKFRSLIELKAFYNEYLFLKRKIRDMTISETIAFLEGYKAAKETNADL